MEEEGQAGIDKRAALQTKRVSRTRKYSDMKDDGF